MPEELQNFEFADFTITSREWHLRSSHDSDIVSPSSDNDRSAWSDDAEE